MNSKQFFDKIVELREVQKRFFYRGDWNDLIRKRALEKEIDDEIERVKNILEQQEKN